MALPQANRENGFHHKNFLRNNLRSKRKSKIKIDENNRIMCKNCRINDGHRNNDESGERMLGCLAKIEIMTLTEIEKWKTGGEIEKEIGL